MVEGLIAAGVAALCWGSYMVPLKRRAGVDPFYFQFLVSLGIALSGLGLWIVRGFPALPWTWGVGSGLYWSVGAALSFLAVRDEGLARASARWMGTGILVSFACGLLLFGESLHPAFAVSGLMLLLGGLALLPGGERNISRQWLGGWKSLGAGLVFGTYLLPLRWSGAGPYEFAVPMGLGILLGGLVVFLTFRPAQTVGLAFTGVAAGVVWNTANVASFLTIGAVGLAVGFPLTQMALVVSIAWGVLAFGESPTRRERLQILSATLLLLSGAVLLGLSR